MIVILIVLNALKNTICGHKVNNKRTPERKADAQSLISRKQNGNLSQTVPWQNTGIRETEEVLQMKKLFTADVLAGIAKTILAMLHVQKINA